MVSRFLEMRLFHFENEKVSFREAHKLKKSFLKLKSTVFELQRRDFGFLLV